MTAVARPSRPSRPTGNQRAAAERTSRSLGRRRVMNIVMLTIMYIAAVIATLPLVFILTHLVIQGASSINLDFFTRMPKPVGEAGGGMANAIIGTLIIISVAAAIGLPTGIGAGLYLA